MYSTALAPQLLFITSYSFQKLYISYTSRSPASRFSGLDISPDSSGVALSHRTSSASLLETLHTPSGLDEHYIDLYVSAGLIPLVSKSTNMFCYGAVSYFVYIHNQSQKESTLVRETQSLEQLAPSTTLPAWKCVVKLKSHWKMEILSNSVTTTSCFLLLSLSFGLAALLLSIPSSYTQPLSFLLPPV